MLHEILGSSGGGSTTKKFEKGTFNYSVNVKYTKNDLGFRPSRVMVFCRHSSTNIRGMIIDKANSENVKFTYYNSSTLSFEIDNSTFGEVITIKDNGFEFVSSNSAITSGQLAFFAFE